MDAEHFDDCSAITYVADVQENPDVQKVYTGQCDPKWLNRLESVLFYERMNINI